MDSIWSEQQNEPFFLPNSLSTVDPFDMESFNPFEDATFSMPEDPISSPSQKTPSSSPQSLQSALDLEFPVEVISSSNSPQTSPVDDWLFNPATGEVTLSQDSREASKRSKNNGEGDSIAACWTSPLCPNKKEDGGRPDSCKGECADFLFAHPSELPDDKKFLSEIMAKSEPKVTLETPHRGVKRQEMESSPEYHSRPRATSSSDLADTPTSVAAASPISLTTKPSTKDNSNTRTSSEITQPISRTAKPKGRVPHNQVEKKYRENVNAQLEALRRVVPVSRQQLSGFDGFDMEDLGAGSRQPSKAVVLSSATAYIKQLERESERMVEEIASLKAQNKTLQSLVKCDDCSLMNYMKRWKIQTGA